jgi:peptidyl-tRNA hydrolase
MPPASDPLRMYLVLRRGAVEELSRAGELAGAAAVACIRRFSDDPAFAEAFEEWRPRPGKVCLRARTASQWQQVRAEPHAEAGDPEGESAVALPPRRRSERGPLLERLQAMSSDLRTAPARAAESDSRSAVTYVLNPAAVMSSGKTVAQVAHAAVMAADGGGVEDWVAAGCPGRVLAPGSDVFAEVAARADCVARVVDAGLTEVPPGTVTVVALAPGPAGGLPASLRGESPSGPDCELSP